MAASRHFPSVLRFPSVLLILALAVGACDSVEQLGTTGPEAEPPEGDPQGTIVGRIDAGLAPGSGGSAMVAAGSADGLEVSAVEVRADGTLGTLATASVDENLGYTIEGVPVGSDRLLVIASSTDGTEVGRVIVHGPVEAAIAVTAAPLDHETTVEASIFVELVGMGLPPEAINPVEISLLVQLDPGTAQDVTISPPDVQGMADGMATADAVLTGVLAGADVDLDAAARFAATHEAALDFAASLDAGAASDIAHDALADAVVQALEEAGASADGLALATAGGATGLVVAMENASADARLDMAKAAVELNLETRAMILESLPDVMSEAGGSAAAALQQAQDQVESATSLSEIEAALAAIPEGVTEELLDIIFTHLGQVPDQVREQLEAQLMDAFAEADLAAGLEGAASPEEILAAIEAYRQDVQQAVDALLDAVSAAGGDFDAEALADLFLALRGGPDIPTPQS